MEKSFGSNQEKTLGNSLLEKTFQLELQDQLERANLLESTVRKGKNLYQFLYDFAPVALFDLDCSKLTAYLETIRASGQTDLRSYFDRHPEKIIECFDNYKMLNVNKAMTELLEAGKVEDVEKNFKKTFSPETIECFKEGILAHAEGKNSYESAVVLKTLTGKRRYLVLRWSVVPGYEKTRSRIMGAFLDSTQLRRVEEDLRKFKTISDGANVGNIITDMDGTFRYVNKAFAHMHGYEVDDLVGKNVFMLHSPEQLEQLERYTGRLHETGSLRNVEIWHNKKDGTSFPTLMNVTIVKDEDGGDRYFSSTAINMTERHRMQKQLEENNRNLEEANIALRVVIENAEKEKATLEERMVSNLWSAVSPIVEKIRKSGSSSALGGYLDLLESTLNTIMEPFSKKLSSQFKNLSPTEVKVAQLICEGKGTKKIAAILHLSDRTVEVHRTNLRRKMGLTNRKVNLQTFLAGIR